MAAFDGKMTRARKEKAAEVSKVHMKTFTAWINASLRKRGLEVKDLEHDLSDGTVLIALVECLTDRPFEKKIHPRPVVLQAHKIENVALALEFMKPYTNLDIDAKDIVDGKVKVLLGLVWRLILNFQVMEVHEDKSKSSAAERNSEAKAKLVKWLSEQTTAYDEVAVTDVTDSFADGLAFCALIHRYNPHLIDWEKVQKMEPAQRLTLAFKIAEDELGIPQLLDPADVTAADPAARPDEQCYMTYLSEFPRAFLCQLQDEVGRVDGVSETAFVSPAALKTSVKEHIAAEDPRVKQAQLEAKQRALEEEEKRVAAAHAEAQAALLAAQARAAEGNQAMHAAEAQAAQLAAQLAAQAEAARAAEAAKRAEANAAHVVATEAARRAEEEARQRAAAEAQAAQLAAQLAAQAEAARRAEAGAQGEAARAAAAGHAAENARKAEAEAAARAAAMAAELERIRRENDALRANLQQISANTLGKLRVVVLGARGLPGTDFFTGKADPYVTLTLERQKEKTKTLKRTNEPRWDAAYTFYVSEPNAELVATVWDWERLSKDTFLGHVVLPVKNMSTNVEKEEWYPLQPKKAQGGVKVRGELHLRIVLQK